MIDCNDARKLLGAYELGVLEGNESSFLEEHLLHCDDCFEELYETAPLLYPFGRKKKHDSVPRWRWRVAMAAVATVLLAVFSSAFLLEDGRVRFRSGPANDEEIQVLSPRTSVSHDQVLFSWKPVDGVATYILMIFDDEGTPILVREVSGTEAVVEFGEEGLLGSGRTYHWKVIGNHSGTETGLPSKIVTFSVPPELAQR